MASRAKAPAKPAGAGTDLAAARERIDGIDRQIQELIAERAQWARQVGKAKGPLQLAPPKGAKGGKPSKK